MNQQTLVHQTGQARGDLMRLEQDLTRFQGVLGGATRNRMVGGIVLLIGIVGLVGFVLSGSQVVGAIAVIGLLVGGPMFFIALLKIGGTKRSIDAITRRVASARAKLDDLKSQRAAAD